MGAYLSRMWGLWEMLSVIGMTVLTALTLTLTGLGLIRTPLDDLPRREPPAADRLLILRAEQAEAGYARERAERCELMVELDAIRRSAIWFPRRDELLPEGDRIPATNLPTRPRE